MPWKNAINLISQLLELTGINILIICIYMLTLLVRMKTKGVSCFTLLQEKQKIINLLLSVYIWGILPIWLGTIIWLLLYCTMHFFLCRKNSARLQTLHELFEVCNKPYPVVRNLKQWDKVIHFQPKASSQYEFQYGMIEHLTGLVALVVLFVFGKAPLSQGINGLYFADGTIVATAFFIFLGKIVFKITYYNNASKYYLSPILTSTLIALIGITYYIIVFFVLLQGP